MQVNLEVHIVPTGADIRLLFDSICVRNVKSPFRDSEISVENRIRNKENFLFIFHHK